MGQRSDSEKLGRRSRTQRTDIQKGNIFPGGRFPPAFPAVLGTPRRTCSHPWNSAPRRATRLFHLLEILKKWVTGHKSRSCFRSEWAAAAGPPCCYRPDHMWYWIKNVVRSTVTEVNCTVKSPGNEGPGIPSEAQERGLLQLRNKQQTNPALLPLVKF